MICILLMLLCYFVLDESGKNAPASALTCENVRKWLGIPDSRSRDRPSNECDLEIPFVDRSFPSLQDVVDAVMTSPKESKRTFAAILGTSGAGKTRFGFEAAKAIKETYEKAGTIVFHAFVCMKEKYRCGLPAAVAEYTPLSQAFRDSKNDAIVPLISSIVQTSLLAMSVWVLLARCRDDLPKSGHSADVYYQKLRRLLAARSWDPLDCLQNLLRDLAREEAYDHQGLLPPKTDAHPPMILLVQVDEFHDKLDWSKMLFRSHSRGNDSQSFSVIAYGTGYGTYGLDTNLIDPTNLVCSPLYVGQVNEFVFVRLTELFVKSLNNGMLYPSMLGYDGMSFVDAPKEIHKRRNSQRLWLASAKMFALTPRVAFFTAVSLKKFARHAPDNILASPSVHAFIGGIQENWDQWYKDAVRRIPLTSEEIVDIATMWFFNHNIASAKSSYLRLGKTLEPALQTGALSLGERIVARCDFSVAPEASSGMSPFTILSGYGDQYQVCTTKILSGSAYQMIQLSEALSDASAAPVEKGRSSLFASRTASSMKDPTAVDELVSRLRVLQKGVEMLVTWQQLEKFWIAFHNVTYFLLTNDGSGRRSSVQVPRRAIYQGVAAVVDIVTPGRERGVSRKSWREPLDTLVTIPANCAIADNGECVIPISNNPAGRVRNIMKLAIAHKGVDIQPGAKGVLPSRLNPAPLSEIVSQTPERFCGPDLTTPHGYEQMKFHAATLEALQSDQRVPTLSVADMLKEVLKTNESGVLCIVTMADAPFLRNGDHASVTLVDTPANREAFGNLSNLKHRYRLLVIDRARLKVLLERFATFGWGEREGN